MPSPQAQTSMRIAVAIATAGRPQILAQTIGRLQRQRRRADRIIVCPARAEDADAQSAVMQDAGVEFVAGPTGASAQRNAILRVCGDVDVVVFFDDDFFPQDDYLAEVEALFRREADIVVATGDVLADDILGPGLAPEQAAALLAAAGALPPERLEAVHNGYGCNMAVRMRSVRERSVEFDEALPLYSWLEDVDFSRRLAPAGRIVRSNRTQGVHLGNKGGRSSGVRLGYSQVANPLYLVRKGTLGRGRAYGQILRNLLANAVKTLRPEPWVDRRGRLAGNLRAAGDMLRGRLHPERILSF